MLLDTNGELFPEGKYTFRVADVPNEVDLNGYKGWQWCFETDTEDGGTTVYNERFMVWLLAPLLRGLGFKEITPGKFDFEPPAALGREFNATIAHVTLEKGKSAGKVVARMKDIMPITSPENRAAMDAQAPPEIPAASASKGDDDVPF